MNDDELKLLAQRGSVYRPLSPRRRSRAIWLLAVALAGLAALWFLWPGEAAPVGPGTVRACLVEKAHVQSACVRPLGRYERPACLTARASLMLCRQGR